MTALFSSSLAVQAIALLPVIKGVSHTDNRLALDLVFASSPVTAESVTWHGATACASSVVPPREARPVPEPRAALPGAGVQVPYHLAPGGCPEPGWKAFC